MPKLNADEKNCLWGFNSCLSAPFSTSLDLLMENWIKRCSKFQTNVVLNPGIVLNFIQTLQKLYLMYCDKFITLGFMKTSLITRLEKYSFGVCTDLADRVGVSSTSLRKVFIYASFLTLGSPLVLYFTLAFWLQIRQHFNRRPSIWDL